MFIWVRSRGDKSSQAVIYPARRDMPSQAVICLSGSGQGVICPARR